MAPKSVEMLPISGLEAKSYDKPLPPRPLKSRTPRLEIQNETLKEQNQQLMLENKNLKIENGILHEKVEYYFRKDEQANSFAKDTRKGLQIIQSAMYGKRKADRLAEQEWKGSYKDKGSDTEVLIEKEEDVIIYVDKNMIWDFL